MLNRIEPGTDIVLAPGIKVTPDHNLPEGCIVLVTRITYQPIILGRAHRKRIFLSYNAALAWLQEEATNAVEPQAT